MLKKYLTITLRSLQNDQVYTCIVIAGLAIGLSAVLMITQYIQFEMSFDKTVGDRDQIHYAYLNWKGQDQERDGPCHPAIAQFAKSNFTEVIDAVRMMPSSMQAGNGNTYMLKREESGKVTGYISLANVYLADKNIFTFFDIPLLEGDSKTALNDKSSAVITKSVADKLFKGESAIGKVFYMQLGEFMKTQWQVTGVVADREPNSSINFDVLYAMETLPEGMRNAWTPGICNTYFKLRAGAQPDELLTQLNSLAKPLKDLSNKIDTEVTIKMYPFSDIHFFRHKNSSTNATVQFTGDRRFITYFIILGGLILLISWWNYINLTTARALKRSKEVILRKINGASRTDLIIQFLLEFFLLNLISLILALTITQLCYSIFARILGTNSTWIMWSEPVFWLWITIFLFTSTIISGVYPAYVMSAYNPASLVRGGFTHSPSGIFVRRGLVLGQFGLSIIMIMGIYIVTKQLIYLQRDPDMDIHKVLVVRTNEIGTGINRSAAFHQWEQKLATSASGFSITASDAYPGATTSRAMVFHLTKDVKRNGFELQVNNYLGDYDKALGIRLLAGRNFKPNVPADSNKIVINQYCAQFLGYDEASNSIGERITLSENGKVLEVIGVVQDFNVNLKMPMRAEIFMEKGLYGIPIGFDYFLVNINTLNTDEALQKLKSEWVTLFSDTPFDYFFLDTYFDTLYNEEKHFTAVFAYFAAIGILITCMGLFGLSLYSITVRAREIAIRKSLGASITGIIWSFTASYVKLVILSAILAAPLGYFVLKDWLQNYPNHVDITADAILLPLLGMCLIAAGTVGYHSLKLANTNPVKVLKSE